MAPISNIIRIILTLIIVAMAIILGVALWDTYMIAPWTRDGRVRVYVVKIAPEISGTIVQVPVRDNQFVRKGDPLFVIDPLRFKIAIQQAEANLENAEANLALQHRNAMRRKGLEGIVSTEEKEDFNTKVRTAQASVDTAKAALTEAKLNLQRSILYSPVNGYITNLNLRVGDYVNTGNSYLSVIDADSFWVYGYFEETKMWGIHVGDVARIKLMGYKQILPGHVVSIARGINDSNANADNFGLQNVNPIFTWVRLAQRIPVRIHIDHIPDTIHLSAGMTATISVGPQTSGRKGKLATWLQDHL
ncbi:HlyD family secretion protein [Commensalibacter sp. M0402]|uniref:efflux RND transporter periplasmic adaptor subunit n=1 Tax=Commensalibacter TaxID=1079922 RepID=UPI0018DCBAEC|nr:MULTISPECIES: HlyD family secretion protein [Commensalibacter]MBI0083242.1 HlyD family secretion protein [Commensalibacter sp. W6292M3]MBI0088479.1 HlyD family secretion protein [Commensalibacter melissae]